MDSAAISDELIIAASQKLKEREFWSKQMAGFTEPAHFPYDFAVPSGEYCIEDSHVFNWDIPSDIAARIITMSGQSDHMLHMILIASITALLARYDGGSDIVIGSVIYRQEIEIRFINTLLTLRLSLNENETFKSLLMSTRQTILQAVEHQNYPHEILIRDLDLPQDGFNFPLFDVAVILDNIQDSSYLDKVPVSVLFSFNRSGQAISAQTKYNPTLYEHDSIQRLHTHLIRFMGESLFSPDIDIFQSSLLSNEEQEQLLTDFNDTMVEYPSDKTIPQLFKDQAQQTPDTIALVSGHNYVSYRQLNQDTDSLALQLCERGVQPGTIVALISRRGIGMIMSILAILKAGGAYLPVSPDSPENRILNILSDSSTPVVVIDAHNIEQGKFANFQDVDTIYTAPIVTPPRASLTNLDDLPLINRSLVAYEKYNRHIGLMMVKNSMSLQASRGCPFCCAYCHEIWPKKHQMRSAENVFEEILLYYNMGVRRFSFVDDVFNLNVSNSKRFFQLVIDSGMEIQLFFGLRGDILTFDYIDLMVKAGTVRMALALETASPRLQKLIGKHLNIEKLRRNINYIANRHPHVIIELNTMLGFPTETEEEALMTLDFIKSINWIHFPYINILKIYPNTAMERIAVENGVNPEAIKRSGDLGYHELPETLPFDKQFVIQYQSRFLQEYFLSKERLLHVLPYQMKVLTEDEIIRKYDSYLPTKITGFNQLLEFAGIEAGELQSKECVSEERFYAKDLDEKLKQHFPVNNPAPGAIRILLLDLSQFFSDETDMLYDLVEPPIGLMALLSYLYRELGDQVAGKVAKSRIDFNDYDQLRLLCKAFKPNVIGIRALTFHKHFFHRTVAKLRSWGLQAVFVAGGPYATSDFNSVLQNPDIDLVVRGEGEVTFTELIRRMLEHDNKLPPLEKLKDINGIAFLPSDAKNVYQTARRMVLIDHFSIFSEQQSRSLEDTGTVSENAAYVIYTSGSTGKPKGVIVEHRNVINVTRWFARRYHVKPGTRLIHLSDYTFDASVNQFFATLLHGATLHLVSEELPMNVPALRDYIDRHRINIINFVPMVVHELLNWNTRLTSIEAVLSGGERLDQSVKNNIRERGYALHNQYGPTETTIDALVGECGPGPVTLGHPIANTKCYILDRRLQLLPIGVTGELFISGHGVARGYLNRVELTHELFLTGLPFTSSRLYRTGDLARWLPDGQVQYLGRRDNQVKIRGFRVELQEIETVIKNHPAVKDAVVIPVGHQAGVLGAYIVPDGELEIGELKEFLSKELPGHMVPSHLKTLASIPLKSSGKIDRDALPPMELSSDSTDYLAPRNAIEQKLVELWAEILGIPAPDISIHANFFELGGHSLRAIMLVTRIHKELDVRMNLKDIFTIPTIRDLSAYIEENFSDSSTLLHDTFRSIDVCEEKQYYPLSSAQQRLFILQRMSPQSTVYNLPRMLMINGKPDLAHLESTFNRLIQRHEVFRTSFLLVDGQPFQRIHNHIKFSISRDVIAESQIQVKINAFVRPFDLEEAPMLRVEMVTLEKTGKYMLLMDMHHIVSDGISRNIMIRDFAAIYNDKTLPLLTLRYRDFSQWQNSLIQSGKIQEQETYWLNRFCDQVPVLDLPTDFPREQSHGFDGSSVTFMLDSDLTHEIRRLVMETGTTLFIFLLSVYTLLLSRYSGQDDFVVGTPITGRTHAELDNIMGMFVNMLAMRNAIEDSMSFRQYLERVRENSLQAFQNQDYPFDRLVRKLDLDRDPLRNPLTDVVFVLQNTGNVQELPALEGSGGLDIVPHKMEHKISKFDLELAAVPVGDGIGFNFDYRCQLFNESTIQNMTEHLTNIIKEVIQDPDIELAKINMMSILEHEQIKQKATKNSDSYQERQPIQADFDF